MVYLLLLITLIACIPTVLAWREWRAWFLLRRDGVEMPVNVRHHWVGKLGFTAQYFIIYDFEGETPAGEPFFNSKYTEVEVQHYRAFVGGEALIVRYAASNPTIRRLPTCFIPHLLPPQDICLCSI